MTAGDELPCPLTPEPSCPLISSGWPAILLTDPHELT